jgi:hypothetical protein
MEKFVLENLRGRLRYARLRYVNSLCWFVLGNFWAKK